MDVEDIYTQANNIRSTGPRIILRRKMRLEIEVAGSNLDLIVIVSLLK